MLIANVFVNRERTHCITDGRWVFAGICCSWAPEFIISIMKTEQSIHYVFYARNINIVYIVISVEFLEFCKSSMYPLSPFECNQQDF